MASYQLDIWGEICPIPLIKTRNVFKKMKYLDVLILETEHSCTARELVVWAQQHSYDYREMEVANGIWRVELIKTHE